MSASRGDHDGPLGYLLAFDVGEVDLVARKRPELFVQPWRGRLDLELPGEEGHGFGQARDGDDLHAGDHGRLAGVLARCDQPAQFFL